jgi:hypothetical protein
VHDVPRRGDHDVAVVPVLQLQAKPKPSPSRMIDSCASKQPTPNSQWLEAQNVQPNRL